MTSGDAISQLLAPSTPSTVARPPAQQRWTLDDIPWDSIDPRLLAQEETLFYIVMCASFVETATDTYTRNLIDHYAGDHTVTRWLDQHWQHEEMQHGQALQRYAQTAWPATDWEHHYNEFFAEFSANCKPEALESSRCLEMASRCTVEMGTAVYYTALSRRSPDPVLRILTRLIREDEIRHYKHFYHHFLVCRDREQMGRTDIVKAIARRLRMIDAEDGRIAVKHAYAAWRPGAPFDGLVYQDTQKRMRHYVGPEFPLVLGAKMTLRLVDMSPRVRRMVQATAVFLTSYLLFGKGTWH